MCLLVTRIMNRPDVQTHPSGQYQDRSTRQGDRYGDALRSSLHLVLCAAQSTAPFVQAQGIMATCMTSRIAGSCEWLQQRLEPCAGKPARTVLRRVAAGNSRCLSDPFEVQRPRIAAGCLPWARLTTVRVLRSVSNDAWRPRIVLYPIRSN